MPERIVTVRHFDNLDEAGRARQCLEDEHLDAFIFAEAQRRGSTSKGVFALQVPEWQLETAEFLLDELLPSEEEEAIGILQGWERDSEEVYEKFEQL